MLDLVVQTEHVAPPACLLAQNDPASNADAENIKPTLREVENVGVKYS
jgi:hypothetical protein